MPHIRLDDSAEMMEHVGEEVGKGAKRMWLVVMTRALERSINELC